MTLLLSWWAPAVVLLSLALVATLLPRTRSWHRLGVVTAWALAAVGVGAAAVVTWSWVVLTEDDLYDAALVVQDSQSGTPGQLSGRRLMALVSDEVGRPIVAESVDGTADEQVYELTPEDADDPAVCVRVQLNAGTESVLPSSSLDVARGRCG